MVLSQGKHPKKYWIFMYLFRKIDVQHEGCGARAETDSSMPHFLWDEL